MSAEHNVSRSPVRSGDTTQSANASCINEDTLEDAAGSANNSIIGKVKSRVSSIIPISFSKWFSPSARINNNDTSINGNLNAESARRRRRIEIEEYDDDYVNDNGDVDDDTRREYKENTSRHHLLTKYPDEEESDSNNDDDAPVPVQRGHRNLKLSEFTQQPPSKRSRISLDVTNIQENSLMQHQPLVASTPAIGQSQRGGSTQLPMFTHSNPKYKGDPDLSRAYNTLSTEEIHLRPSKCPSSFPKMNENILHTVEKSPAIRSRRTLHIPSVSHTAAEGYMPVSLNLKRQTYPSTIISGTQDEGVIEDDEKPSMRAPANVSFMAETNLHDQSKLNGGAIQYVGNKRQKLINDTEELGTTVEGNDIDSASESSEGCSGSGNMTTGEIPHNTVVQKKTGLFNMSSMNSRNGSRTSSFGNAINFYSHLEGRKSLFSSTAQGGVSGGALNALNNSTLSLTSLNRRQFNASIYGSTSALSDSRLLNTFSPFYKGKTTYGGAAAYKKYGVGPGGAAGASKWVPRMTPTLIRPTSSLSTLSSSNNSLAAGGAIFMGPNASGETSSAISSTAKRILDLINDFATPLSEAKKMANNLKTNQPQLLPQTKSRLNDSDLQASRAMRLSQVRTPYMRPAVTLHPTKGAPLPPVRELQVPSMSQLLQMKKMQSTTERSRQITMQNSNNTCLNVTKDYTLPIAVDNNADGNDLQSQQQKHTNKIKNKSRSARITASKDVIDLVEDEPPLVVNLPNIAFPSMKSVPKFDIVLPIPAASNAIPTKTDLKVSNATTKPSPTASTPIMGSNKSATFALNHNASGDKNAWKQAEIVSSTINSPNRTNFKFSAPLAVKTTTISPNNTTPMKNYKFSPPTTVNAAASPNESSPVTTKLQQSPDIVPKLKSGSVLDALSKPFIMPKSTVNTNDNATIPQLFTNENKTFGTKFKKSSDKWECNTCLVRNEKTATKCVACETPQSTTVTSAPSSIPIISTGSSFGNQFKKPSDEWECDTCMIRNKQQTNKCVACETPRKNGTSSPKNIAAAQPISVVNSFGDAFKPKANTWECSTCLINNKSECSECVACQTKKPGSSNSVDTINAPPTVASTFKFGFGQSTTAAVNKEDVGFKSIAAAQKASKWECEACMTRNDSERLKCVCCEQAKPGTQAVNESTPKFSFGSTAASKYTFGFGANADTSKKVQSESDATEGSIELKTNRKEALFASSTVAATSVSTGFTFGITPSTSKTTAESQNPSTDAADGGNESKISKSDQSTGHTFVFGVKSSTATNSTTPAPSSFNFGASKSSVANTIPTTTTSTIPSVKASLPTSTAGTGAPVNSESASGFTFDSAAAAAKTPQVNFQSSSGFSFGAPVKSAAERNKQAENPASAGFTFKAPSTTVNVTATNNNTKSFAFGTVKVGVTPPASSESAATTSQAAAKPTFSFGNSSLSTTPTASVQGNVTSTSSAANTTSAPSANAGGFSFGVGSGIAPSTPKAIFGVSAPVINASTAPNASTTSTTFSTSTAATNVFGSFGSSASTSATTTSTSFGANSVKPIVPPTQNVANAFGSLNQSSLIESKPTAPATLIFGNSSGHTGTALPTTTAAFAFGSALSTAATTISTATGSVTSTTSTSWPKSNFVFGSSANSNAVSNANEAPKQAMFGSFGSMQNNAGPAMAASAPVASIFGNSTTNGASNATSTFGATATTANATNIFGSNTSSAMPATNLFGNASDNAPAPTFGTAPTFGSNNNASNATPTFGSTGVTNPAFGGFGAATSTAINNDGASAAKKSEPAFNFGASTSQSTTGGFNFGATAGSAPKPAFNFAPSNAPTFNFTGSNETPAAKPFLFGATPSAPIFNFSGGAVEGTPNAPFQFSAGAAPASSNIFAPTPTPGAQTALQARRKIRQPTRRLTPR